MLSEQLCESMRREQAAGNAKTGARGQDRAHCRQRGQRLALSASSVLKPQAAMAALAISARNWAWREHPSPRLAAGGSRGRDRCGHGDDISPTGSHQRCVASKIATSSQREKWPHDACLLSVVLSVGDRIGKGAECHCSTLGTQQSRETANVHLESPRIAELGHEANVGEAGSRAETKRACLIRQHDLASLKTLPIGPRCPLGNGVLVDA